MANIQDLKNKYKQAKNAQIGETVRCAGCNTMFVKSSYQQAFCKTKSGTTCKDFYWNNVTPKKRKNMLRISPANARFMAKIEANRENSSDDYDGSWDEHNF